MDGGADALSLLAPVGRPALLRAAPDARVSGCSAPAGVRGRPAAALASLGAGPQGAVGRRRRAASPSRRRSATPRRTSRTSPRATSGRSARRDPNATTGWLGRYLDRVGSPNVPIQGLSLDGSLSPSLATSSVAVAATNNISDYQFQARGVWGTMQTRMRSTYGQLGTLSSADPITAQARQAQSNAAGLSSDLASVGSGSPPAGVELPRGEHAASRRACRPSPACSARRRRPATTCRCAA